MDLNSAQASPVLTDPSPLNKSRLGIHSSLFPYSQSGPSFSTSVLSIPRKKPAKLDDVRSNGWLDAMKSSSPPRKKILKDVNIDVSSDDADVTYLSWMMKYPSALNCFQQIMRQARNKQIVIFLDYDGTLSPIVDDPDRAFMSNEMRSVVSNVAKYFPTAIISGRRRDKVYDLVGLTELYYAGSHGMDIMLPIKNTSSANDSNCIKDTDQLTSPNYLKRGKMSSERAKSANGLTETNNSGLNFNETELTLGLPGESRKQISGAKRGNSDGMELSLGSSTSGERRRDICEVNHSKNEISTGNKPPAKAQVIGWPPVRSYRKNVIEKCKYVKVAVDGAPYLRKVDLEMYDSYQKLLNALENMFTCLTICNSQSESKLMDLTNGVEYVPTYEDKDGDWMLVGDVPWKMFVDTCKRIRLMKSTEAIGLAPRTPGRSSS